MLGRSLVGPRSPLWRILEGSCRTLWSTKWQLRRRKSRPSGSAQIPASRSTPRSIDHYTEDHTAASKELDAIMDYLDKLKPQFETQVTSIEERKARREAEIEGLKEALAVLDGTSVPVL